MSQQATKQNAIGIDLGTIYSSIAVMRNGKVELIPDEQGQTRTTCCVAFTETGRLFGNAAKDQFAMNPSNTVSDIKRLISRDVNDAVVQRGMKFWPFKLVLNGQKHNRLKIQVNYEGELKSFYPEEITAMFMSRMKELAENYLNEPVNNAVISVPACFNYAQRMATLDAAKIAGINVLRLINEPTAAAFCYDVNYQQGGDRNVVIFDLGGCTTDISVITFEEKIVDIKATAGDMNLGGDDFDFNMVDYCLQDFYQKHKIDLTTNRRAIRLLLKACERAKRELSAHEKASIQIDSLYESLDYNITITRQFFEELNTNLFYRIHKLIEKVMFDSKINLSEIDDVILVGGSTRIPAVQRILKEFFQKTELNKSINPDEAVAYGAAVLAAMLSGDKSEIIKDLLILDVAPLSMGIETIDGLMSPIVHHNCTIPVIKHVCYATHLNLESKFKKLKPHICEDGRPGVLIEVYEGEHRIAKENNYLGKIELPLDSEIDAEIEVQFDIDVNSILTVTVTDKLSGNFTEATITKGHFKKNEIARLILDAEKYHNDDLIEQNRISYRNSFESFCFNLKDSLANSGLHELIKKQISDSCDHAIKWIEENDMRQKSEMEIEFKKVAKASRLLISQNTLSIYQSAYSILGDMSFLIDNGTNSAASNKNVETDKSNNKQAKME